MSLKGCCSPSPVMTCICSRRDALEALDLLGVRAHLEEGGGLHPAGELGVGDLVGPGAEVRARALDLQEEVGVAAPAAVEERGLVDDVGTGPHGGEGLGLGGGERGDGVAGHGDLDDGPALGDQPFDVLGLVLAAAARQHVEHGVVTLRAVALAAGGGQLELGEVLARGEAGEVARAERERSVIEKVHAALPRADVGCEAESVRFRSGGDRGSAHRRPLVEVLFRA